MLLVENIAGPFERTPLNESKRSKNWMKGRKYELDERKDESRVRKQEGHFLYLDLLTSLLRNKGSDCSSQNCLQGLCSHLVIFLKNSLKRKKKTLYSLMLLSSSSAAGYFLQWLEFFLL